MNQKICIVVLALVFEVLRVAGQGTAFYYQGSLSDGGSPANGQYDLQFSLYNASTNGSLVAGPLTNYNMTVSGGLFSTNLDFGAVFSGNNYWLAIGVRTNGSTNAFTGLLPRQAILPVPYAIFANSASNLLGTLAVNQLAGTLSATQLAGTYSSPVSFTNTGNTFVGTVNVSGTFSGIASGNGAGLTNLNGSYIASGTVADARLSTNVALLNGNQTFTGTNTFTNWNNSFTGNFFGNGLVGWVPVSNTSTQAVRDTGYLLLNSSLTTVTLPASSALQVGDIIRISGAGSGGWLLAQNASQYITGTFLSVSNSLWLRGSASTLAWQSIAASANGLNLVAGATGAGGGIYTSTDGGKTWNSSSTTYAPQSVASSSDGTVLFGIVYNGGLVVSTNSGSSWYNPTALASAEWECVAVSASGTTVAAVGLSTPIRISTNSGTSWQSANNAPTANWSSVAVSSDGTKMAATVYGGSIYTSGNSGVTWTQRASVNNWRSIASSADGTKLVAVVTGGSIYTSPDSSVTWNQQSGAPTSNWYNVTCSKDGGRIIAVSTSGVVYISADYGITWTKQSVVSQTWSGAACSADGTIAAAVASAYSTGGGNIYYWQTTLQSTAATTVGTGGYIAGGPGSAIELQYLGNNQFMPVSSIGTFWGN